MSSYLGVGLYTGKAKILHVYNASAILTCISCIEFAQLGVQVTIVFTDTS